MDKLLVELFWITVFGAGCYVLTLVIRRIVETAKPTLRIKPYAFTFSRWWNQVILYVLPILLGSLGAIGLRGTTVMPEGVESFKAAVVYGMVLGSMSSMLYKILRMLIMKKAGVCSESELAMATNLIEEDPKPVTKDPPDAPTT